MGTNLFFEFSDNQSSLDMFGRRPPIHLEYFSSVNKVLKLEPAKIKPRKPEIEGGQLKITYNLDWDYDTLLQKWDEGTLALTDMLKDEVNLPAKKDNPKEPIEKIEENMEYSEPVPVNIEQNAYDEDELSLKELQEDYKKLKLLAKRPARRKIEIETVEMCENKYKTAYDFHNLEKQVKILFWLC